MLQKLVTCLSLSLLLLTSALPIPAITPTPQAEAVSAAMWTHGTSVQVENPGVVNVTRYGFYTRVDGNSGAATWFHFAIPTTVILSDVRKQVDSVILQFESLGAAVTNVHVYDGPAKIAVYDSMNLAGTHNSERFPVPGKPSVFSGIGISVRVQFSTSSPRYILFKTAGADLL
jgi:hypothetical protein